MRPSPERQDGGAVRHLRVRSLGDLAWYHKAGADRSVPQPEQEWDSTVIDTEVTHYAFWGTIPGSTQAGTEACHAPSFSAGVHQATSVHKRHDGDTPSPPSRRHKLWRQSDSDTYAGRVTEVLDCPSTASRVRLVLGGVLVGVVLFLELYFGLVLAWAWYSPWPPAWPGVIISLVAALIGPTAGLLVWRSGQRSGKPRTATLRHTEFVGGAFGLCSLVVLFGMLLVTAVP